MPITFDPMRSFIYVDVVREEYRHKLHHWLYYHHVPESVAKFRPFCSLYQYYGALPVPPGGENFGTARMMLTEHHWLVNPLDPITQINALQEYMPVECLIWQGTMPEDAANTFVDGDAGRSTGGDNGCPPFVFAFTPMWWETDVKGKTRMMTDGPNYRWNFAVDYPDGVSMEEGDGWLIDEVLPHFAKSDACTRILTSKVKKEINGCPMDRVVEMWFTGPTAWNRLAVVEAGSIKPPSWAKEGEAFPYLRPGYGIRGIFITDFPQSDNYDYAGYKARR